MATIRLRWNDRAQVIHLGSGSRAVVRPQSVRHVQREIEALPDSYLSVIRKITDREWELEVETEQPIPMQALLANRPEAQDVEVL